VDAASPRAMAAASSSDDVRARPAEPGRVVPAKRGRAEMRGDPVERGTHRTQLTVVPLAPRVIADLAHIVDRFAAGCADGRDNFVAFRELWSAMRFADIFATSKAVGRAPGIGETPAQYTGLLLAAAARHLSTAAHAEFAPRLGGLFLCYALHAAQPPVPASARAHLPITEADWANVEALEEELRARRHSSGFKVRQRPSSTPPTAEAGRPRAHSHRRTRIPRSDLSRAPRRLPRHHRNLRLTAAEGPGPNVSHMPHALPSPVHVAGVVSCAFDALARSGGGSGGLVTITAESDRFLTHMMRMIAGTLVQVHLTSHAAPRRVGCPD